MRVTVVIPTLTAGQKLTTCLASLAAQDCRDFEVLVVDNGSRGLDPEAQELGLPLRVLSLGRNLGFAGAMAEALKSSSAPFFMTLNDDTVADTACVRRLVAALEAEPSRGACAPQIRLASGEGLDSAGMAIARDGTSKQRAHLESAESNCEPREVLFPSGCAAIYKREALDQVGGFDPDFFLYCEDTDVGLRLRRMGWSCLYVPDAVVHHDYSATAGGGSAMKVYYVERNRLAVLAKNFPWDWIVLAPFFSMTRYVAHVFALGGGRGYRGQGDGSVPYGSFAASVLRAYADFFRWLPKLLRARRRLGRSARLTMAEFRRLLSAHRISIFEAAGV